MQNTILGIILGLIATFLFNVGALIQKNSLNEISEIKFNNLKSSVKEMIKNHKFMIGFSMEAFGGMLHKIAINYGGLSLVQPILSVGFIFLAIFSKRITNESIDTKTAIGIILLILTPFFLVWSEISVSNIAGDRTEDFVSIILFLGLLSLLNLVFRFLANEIPFFWVFVPSIWLSMGALCIQSAMIFIGFEGYDLILDFQIIIFKLFTQSDYLFVWIFFLLVGIFDTVGWFSLQMGLQRNPAAHFVPIVLTLYMLLPVIAGVIMFNQHIQRFPIYILGLCFASIGTLILGKYKIIKEKMR